MALRTILAGSHPRLRTVARPVRKINEHILEILDDMADTLHNAEGVGLAAPQVGINRRIVVIETADQGLMELINPEIVASEGAEKRVEACLSFPGVAGEVVRPTHVTVRAMDRNGVEQTYEGEGLLAQAFCHELDHLDGILYVDKVIRWLPVEGEDEEAEDADASGTNGAQEA